MKCQCEHAAHLDRAARTPNGNPGHKYGQEFVDLVTIPTARGVYEVCSDCSADCQATSDICTVQCAPSRSAMKPWAQVMMEAERSANADARDLQAALLHADLTATDRALLTGLVQRYLAVTEWCRRRLA